MLVLVPKNKNKNLDVLKESLEELLNMRINVIECDDEKAVVYPGKGNSIIAKHYETGKVILSKDFKQPGHYALYNMKEYDRYFKCRAIKITVKDDKRYLIYDASYDLSIGRVNFCYSMKKVSDNVFIFEGSYHYDKKNILDAIKAGTMLNSKNVDISKIL